MELVSREVHHANTVNSCSVHRHLLEHAPAFIRRELNSGSYYLEYMDDKGDHIFVDKDLIVGADCPKG
jgi:hypothetical protein